MQPQPPRWPLAVAGVLGACAVAAGAFGAHGLKNYLSPPMLDVWNTAADYHLAHALALLALGLAVTASPARFAERSMVTAVVFMALGTVIFSGSLYGLALTGIGWLGAITPIGGTLLIAGWLFVIRVALTARGDSSDTPA